MSEHGSIESPQEKANRLADMEKLKESYKNFQKNAASTSQQLTNSGTTCNTVSYTILEHMYVLRSEIEKDSFDLRNLIKKLEADTELVRMLSKFGVF